MRRMMTIAGAAALALNLWGENAVKKITVDASAPYHVSPSRDDVARLQDLALATGWEFSPDQATSEALKSIGIRRIRCINVDVLPGAFDADGNYRIEEGSHRIDWHLDTAREVGAVPHIIIGVGMPESLFLDAGGGDAGERVMGLQQTLTAGPNDERLYRNYWIAYFEYVVLTRGAENAVFEIFNEPDIGGVISRSIPKPERGTEALYDEMFRSYLTIMEARAEFEKRHPDHQLTVGAPAVSWAFTFSFGDFNWINRFIEDCARAGVLPDFFGVHFYGNITSLYGEYPSYYPSYREMFASLASVRDRFAPGVPLEMNEWGPSYHVHNGPEAMFNATVAGSVWSLEFLGIALEQPLDKAMYLVTTDLAQPDGEGKLENVWGWCSLFLNPAVYPGAIPKVQYHLFRMISELRGDRILTRNQGNVHVFACLDRENRTLQILLWNFALEAPEGAPVIDRSVAETVDLFLYRCDFVRPGVKLEVKQELLSYESGDIASVYLAGGEVTMEAAQPQAPEYSEVVCDGDAATVRVELPPGGIRLITVSW